MRAHCAGDFDPRGLAWLVGQRLARERCREEHGPHRQAAGTRAPNDRED